MGKVERRQLVVAEADAIRRPQDAIVKQLERDKLCGIEAYAPTDNVSELTARINDEGWESCFANWLNSSQLRAADALLVFSVGGGSRAKNVSVNLVWAIEVAQMVGAKIFGIVGRDGGFTAACAQACVIVPPLFPDHITPHTEGLCAVLWHLLVSHPVLQKAPTRWETLLDRALRPAVDRPASVRPSVLSGEPL